VRASSSDTVTPAEAGVQQEILDTRLRGYDIIER